MQKKKRRRKVKPGERFCYNDEVGHWWMQRSVEGAHRRAYRNIADFIQASYTRAPRVIVDYACGAGNLLSLLSRRFPYARLVGLDGSSFLLGLARRRFSHLRPDCAARISLIETPLPSFDVLRGRADLIVFCFPHMIPFPDHEDIWMRGPHGNENDRVIARRLAPEGPHLLEQGRRISLNLRWLLARGGICVRVEYATMQRHELSPPELLQVAFEEGSLDTEVGGRMSRHWFRLLASAYFRSGVLEDVYQQTGDERDRDGGYLITVLRAI